MATQTMTMAMNTATNMMNSTMTVPDVMNMSIPTDIASLWAFLASFSAFRDWAKLILLGGALESIRRMGMMWWNSIMESFVITAEFTEHDETYTWMMVWLAQQPQWKNARNVTVSTRRIGQNTIADRLPGEDDEKDVDEKKLVSLVPTHNLTQYIWYKKSLVQIIRARKDADTYWTSSTETLVIRMFTRNRSTLHSLLLDAKRSHKKNSEQRVSVYVVDPQYNEWVLTGSRPKRPLSSVVLDEGLKELLLEDAKDFLASELWYAERGIPWRRGYLLHGCPGSGKTSLIHALAGELNLPIYVISLSMRRLDDAMLNTLISRLPSKSLALMEDIDAAFHRGLTRESQASSSSPSTDPTDPNSLDLSVPSTTASSPPPPPPPPPSNQHQQPDTHITLSGILAAIDGVTAQEGRILFATTNKYDSLDPALVRPGRLDVHVEFEYASRWQTEELFRCFFPGTVEEEGVGVVEGGKEGGEAATETDETGSTGSEKPLIQLDEGELEDTEIISEKPPTSPAKPSPSPTPSKPPTNSTTKSLFLDSRTPCPPLSPALVTKLARAFAAQIPDREFSMAEIQGHLMRYKTRPRVAIAEAGAWVERERGRRRGRKVGGGGSTGGNTGAGGSGGGSGGEKNVEKNAETTLTEPSVKEAKVELEPEVQAQ